jgi:hypothetical protein
VTQISRPFQIALAAVVLLLAVWFLALRGHSGGSSASAPAAASTPAPPASGSSSSGAGASQNAPGGGTKASAGGAYHGSAPGVAGLTRAIDKARGAVKLSERNAQQLRQKSAQASSAAAASSAASPTAAAQPAHGAKKSRAATPSTSTSRPAGVKGTPPSSGAGSAKKVAGAPAKQSLVESELERGSTVIVLFWSAKGSVDRAVHRQLASVQASERRRSPGHARGIAVHYSSAAEVGQYGRITRSLQVFQTPTMLVIDPSGRTKTLTGLADAYAIHQAIEEARHS